METLDNLSNILESILFVAGNPVPIDIISEKLGVSTKEVQDAAKKLQEKFTDKSGLRLLMFNKKLQLSSNPEYKDYVSSVLNPIKEREFTRTILECSAIIAYKQPITKGELAKSARIKLRLCHPYAARFKDDRAGRAKRCRRAADPVCDDGQFFETF